jgi:hypothetical protein
LNRGLNIDTGLERREIEPVSFWGSAIDLYQLAPRVDALLFNAVRGFYYARTPTRGFGGRARAGFQEDQQEKEGVRSQGFIHGILGSSVDSRGLPVVLGGLLVVAAVAVLAAKRRGALGPLGAERAEDEGERRRLLVDNNTQVRKPLRAPHVAPRRVHLTLTTLRSSSIKPCFHLGMFTGRKTPPFTLHTGGVSGSEYDWQIHPQTQMARSDHSDLTKTTCAQGPFGRGKYAGYGALAVDEEALEEGYDGADALEVVVEDAEEGVSSSSDLEVDVMTPEEFQPL